MNRTELKATAKTQITGKIGILFLCGFLIAIISGAPATVLSFAVPGTPLDPLNPDYLAFALSTGWRSLAQAALGIIIGASFTISTVLIYIGLADDKYPQVADIFKGFAIFGKAVALNIMTTVLSFLWGLLFVVPGIIKSISYSMAPYILAENQDMNPRQAIEESKRVTQGHKGELFVLSLSFIGWYLLALPTLGLIMIYVSPYINATRANAYLKLKELAGQNETMAAAEAVSL